MAKHNLSGFVFYKGPSMLDGKPIVAILTGLAKRSSNEKTGGGLYQTWILREDINPIEANATGQDFSICGDCKHKGTPVFKKGKWRISKRPCYVRLDTAPLNIWKTYHRGRYPTLAINPINDLLAGGMVRGGSYGDPAAVPFHVWESMLRGLDTGAAYTHQWRRFPELAAFCMASVDTPEEQAQAKLLGFRTFRVRGPNEPLLKYERPCPAAKESGYRTTCDLCRACGGNAAKARVDMAIIAHGIGAASFTTQQLGGL